MAKKKIKKFLKKAAPLLAVAGLGKAFMDARNRRAMIDSASADDGFGFMKMKDFGPYSSKVMNAAKNKIKRNSILANPNINKMDLSEVDLDYTAPDMSQYRNMDMGLSPFAAKDGGRARKRKGFSKKKKKQANKMRKK